ncbi:hypothetical protein EDB85DRAFT_1893733 [Lactarius pseudohatsudake]|nr:hypothetical protein EDB85DRAFT_1893733 [Lactarius pseudohatsudake]
MSTNRAPPSNSDPQTIPTEGDDTHAEEVRQPTMCTTSGGPDQSTTPEHPLPPSDHLPVQIGTPMPHDLETSLVEKAWIDLDHADKVEELINRSNTWEGVVGKIKWVMDKLSPVAEMVHKVLLAVPERRQRVVPKRVTREFDLSRDKYSRLVVVGIVGVVVVGRCLPTTVPALPVVVVDGCHTVVVVESSKALLLSPPSCCHCCWGDSKAGGRLQRHLQLRVDDDTDYDYADYDDDNDYAMQCDTQGDTSTYNGGDAVTTPVHNGRGGQRRCGGNCTLSS